jgi:hypothetical protein
MKKICAIMIALMAHSMFLMGQGQADINLLKTDSTWVKEVFYFPLNFANEIKFEGVEEARFPQKWADTSSTDFWSYVFVWEIKTSSRLMEKDLEDNLQIYFNGLLNWQHTNAVFLQKEAAENHSIYLGKIKTFDAFFTKKPITLQVIAEIHFCAQQKKSLIFFRFSPKPYEHEIWHKLNGVQIETPDCSD